MEWIRIDSGELPELHQVNNRTESKQVLLAERQDSRQREIFGIDAWYITAQLERLSDGSLVWSIPFEEEGGRGLLDFDYWMYPPTLPNP